MTLRYLLIASIALVGLGGCSDGSRSRFRADGTTPPISAPNLRDSLTDAAVAEPNGSPDDPDASALAPASPFDAGGSTEEIDNTVYWDAATTPTADNVRGIDAGEPDR